RSTRSRARSARGPERSSPPAIRRGRWRRRRWGRWRLRSRPRRRAGSPPAPTLRRGARRWRRSVEARRCSRARARSPRRRSRRHRARGGSAWSVWARAERWAGAAGRRSPQWDAGEGAVLPSLRWAGARRLCALLLTHDDGDHTGGAQAVLRGVGVGGRWAPAPRPGVPGPLERYAARGLTRGDSLVVGPLVRVLWPPPADSVASAGGDPDQALARRGGNAAALALAGGEGAARGVL